MKQFKLNEFLEKVLYVFVYEVATCMLQLHLMLLYC